MSRPSGIFPGKYVFQFPPPAVEARELSGALAEGEAVAAGAEGDAAATLGGVLAAGAAGVAVGETCATITGDFAGVGDGVGVPFFFLSFLLDFVGEAGGG